VVSFDGTNAHKYIPASTSVIYDITMDSSFGDMLAAKKTIYAAYLAGGVPSAGSVYVASTYRYSAS